MIEPKPLSAERREAVKLLHLLLAYRWNPNIDSLLQHPEKLIDDLRADSAYWRQVAYDDRASMVDLMTATEALIERTADCPHCAEAGEALDRAISNLGEAKLEHGKNCPKVLHVGSGYLHAEADDRPYDVDGVAYCGRCHHLFEKAQEER